jgi:hypothetical protein
MEVHARGCKAPRASSVASRRWRCGDVPCSGCSSTYATQALRSSNSQHGSSVVRTDGADIAGEQRCWLWLCACDGGHAMRGPSPTLKTPRQSRWVTTVPLPAREGAQDKMSFSARCYSHVVRCAGRVGSSHSVDASAHRRSRRARSWPRRTTSTGGACRRHGLACSAGDSERRRVQVAQQ